MKKSKSDFDFLIDNIEVIKDNYISLLSPFFNTILVADYKRYIYSFSFSCRKKDLIWEYLNGDIDDIIFYEIVKHLKK